MDNNNSSVDPTEQRQTDSSKQSPPSRTKKETRQIVTPYAFFVADSLLGTKLAGPFQRGIALTIDLFFVAMLTTVSSLVLAAVAAATFFRAGNRLKRKKRFNAARLFLRLLVALLLFVIAVGVVDEINLLNSDDEGESEVTQQQLDKLAVVGITAQYMVETSTLKNDLESGECKPNYECIKSLGEELIDDTVGAGIGLDGVTEAVNTYAEVMAENLTSAEQTKLLESLTALSEVKVTKEPDPIIPSDVEKDIKEYVDKEIVIEPQGSSPKGIVNWLKDLIEELGLGFGWAAFYFSVFTAWWKGQTPGKKIMGIQVVKLDNQALNLWESFGRYGGYGAGLATGLLGFLQIFWDPNRQAIQDKISETLVIDLRHPKVTLLNSENQQE